MLRSTLILTLALSAAPALNAQTAFVDAAAPAGGDGSSWASAYDDLHDALGAAVAGDVIWVAEGQYDAGGTMFTVPADVTLLGGFAAGDALELLRRPRTKVSVLDAGNASRVVRLNDGSLIDGFTIQNGRAGGKGGGGVLVDGTSPTLRNLLFTGNTNVSGRGSALTVLNGGNPLVQNAIFNQNGDNASGHVIDVFGANGTYEHLTVYDNVENGFHIQSGASPVIRSSVFALNTGRGICVISFSDAPTIENCHFWNNSVSHMHVTGSELNSIAAVNALSYASNNITGDPLFVDGPAGNVQLTAASPLVDAGVSTAPALTDVDPWGAPRMLDGDLDGTETVDVGAHEFAHVALEVTGTSAPGQTLNISATGTPGMTVEVWIGAKWTALADPPFGTMFFDPKIRRRRIELGTTPLNSTFKLPGLLPSGLDLVYQARVFDATLTRGNWSNAIYTELQ